MSDHIDKIEQNAIDRGVLKAARQVIQAAKKYRETDIAVHGILLALADDLIDSVIEVET